MEHLVEEVWNRRNLDAVPGCFVPGAVMHHGGPGDRGGHDMEGIPAFREGYMRPTQAAFPDLHHTIEEMVIEGDRVALRFHGEGTHEGELAGVAPTHKRMRYEGIALFRMEGHLIAEVWVHSSAAKVIAALAD